MADGSSPLPPITDITLTCTLPAAVVGEITISAHQFDRHCIAITVTAPGGPWTTWMDDDDQLDDMGGASVTSGPGTEPGEAVYWVDTAHGNVGAHAHRDSCADSWYGGCDCGAETALTSEIRGLLLDAGRRLVGEHQKRRAERSQAER